MEVGEVTNYFEHVKAAAIKLAKPLKVGDIIQIKGGEIEFKQKIESMQIDKNPVVKAKAGDEIGIKVKNKVRRGYKVFKA
jgi:putative protease